MKVVAGASFFAYAPHVENIFTQGKKIRAEVDDHSLTVSLSLTAPPNLPSPARLVASSRPATPLYQITAQILEKIRETVHNRPKL
jgi:hypothetical protein